MSADRGLMIGMRFIAQGDFVNKKSVCRCCRWVVTVKKRESKGKGKDISECDSRISKEEIASVTIARNMKLISISRSFKKIRDIKGLWGRPRNAQTYSEVILI